MNHYYAIAYHCPHIVVRLTNRIKWYNHHQMTISKHIHSCLFITDQDKNILVDPGNYTYEERGLDLNSINNLDYLLITHEHPDHMHLPFIKEILNKFPSVQILSNRSVSEILKNGGITTVDSLDGVKMIEAPHERIFGGTPPLNVQFDIFDKLSDPGDSLQFTKIKEILALPLQAPWGSLTAAVEKAVSMKPKIILPLHDWHWNEKAREAFYERLKDYFAKFDIDFIPLKTGEEITV